MPEAFSTVRALLAEARRDSLPRLDAELLLAHVLGCRRTWLLAHDDAPLDMSMQTRWRELAARRRDDEPLAYLVGTKEFHGLALAVDARVLVPRPETELLVEIGLDILRTRGSDATFAPALIDLGTGSGAIALALKAGCERARVCASDSSEGALDVARANAGRLQIDIEFRPGSWWQPWHGERFDLALANPPYVRAGDLHLAALRHEPLGALEAGVDGLDALRAVVAGAPAHLRGGGALWLEHGHDQAAEVRALLAGAGFGAIESRPDLAGTLRCTGGCVEA